MPRPYVSAVTFLDDQIVLTVQLDEYLAGQSVEISGYATQNSGGYATFYGFQTAEKNPDGTVVTYVKAAPAQEFMEGDPVTVFLRAAKVWVTVLREEGWKPENHPTKPATDGTTWDTVAKVGWAASNGQASSWSPDQALAGGEPSFQG